MHFHFRTPFFIHKPTCDCTFQLRSRTHLPGDADDGFRAGCDGTTHPSWQKEIIAEINDWNWATTLSSFLSYLLVCVCVVFVRTPKRSRAKEQDNIVLLLAVIWWCCCSQGVVPVRHHETCFWSVWNKLEPWGNFTLFAKSQNLLGDTGISKKSLKRSQFPHDPHWEITKEWHRPCVCEGGYLVGGNEHTLHLIAWVNSHKCTGSQKLRRSRLCRHRAGSIRSVREVPIRTHVVLISSAGMKLWEELFQPLCRMQFAPVLSALSII